MSSPFEKDSVTEVLIENPNSKFDGMRCFALPRGTAELYLFTTAMGARGAKNHTNPDYIGRTTSTPGSGRIRILNPNPQRQVVPIPLDLSPGPSNLRLVSPKDPKKPCKKSGPNSPMNDPELISEFVVVLSPIQDDEIHREISRTLKRCFSNLVIEPMVLSSFPWNYVDELINQDPQIFRVSKVKLLKRLENESGGNPINLPLRSVDDLCQKLNEDIRQDSKRPVIRACYDPKRNVLILVFLNVVEEMKRVQKLLYRATQELNKITGETLPEFDESFKNEPKPIEDVPVDEEDSSLTKDFHQEQKEAAYKLLQELNSGLNEEKWYCDFVIVTPPRVSLRTQTVLRLVQSFVHQLDEIRVKLENLKTTFGYSNDEVWSRVLNRSSRKDCDGDSSLWDVVDRIVRWADERVIYSSISKKNSNRDEFKQLLKRVSEAKTAGGHFLVIHDESHWGINSDGQVARLLFSSEESNLCDYHVDVIHISATPWNGTNLYSRESLKIVKLDNGRKYISSSSYVKRGEEDTDYVKIVDCETGTSRGTKDLQDARTWELMVDYARCILEEEYSTGSPFTRDVVNFMKNPEPRKPAMIVIRVNGGGHQEALVKWLMILRNHCKQSWFDSWNIFSNSISDGVYTNFDDLKCYRCLLVVVETAKMGDTLPEMQYYDLRTRYTSDAPLSTFFQDVGRCFGYRKHQPILCLTSKGAKNLRGVSRNVDKYVRKLRKEAAVLTHKFEVDPVQKSLWYDLSDDVQQHVLHNRVFLEATPQAGKTGAFLALISMVIDCKAFDNIDTSRLRERLERKIRERSNVLLFGQERELLKLLETLHCKYCFSEELRGDDSSRYDAIVIVHSLGRMEEQVLREILERAFARLSNGGIIFIQHNGKFLGLLNALEFAIRGPIAYKKR